MGAYNYLKHAYEELIDSRDPVKEQNRALHCMVAGHYAKDEKESEIRAGHTILSMASGEQKGPSWVPPYYGT